VYLQFGYDTGTDVFDLLKISAKKLAKLFACFLLNTTASFCKKLITGTNVLDLLKISAKKLAKLFACFLLNTTASFCKKLITSLVFEKKTPGTGKNRRKL
jgi:hypothetical protein